MFCFQECIDCCQDFLDLILSGCMSIDSEHFMRFAIEEVRRSLEPLKCGVVIVRNGEVIARADNSQRIDCDAVAHAEVKAIRAAGKVVKNKNLEGCEIYCTCEPCIMCLTAIAYAKIGKVTYGVDLKDVSPKSKRVDIPLETFLEVAPHKIEVRSRILAEECRNI